MRSFFVFNMNFQKRNHEIKDSRDLDNQDAWANLDLLQVLVDIVHRSLSFRPEFGFQGRNTSQHEVASNFLGFLRCLQTSSRADKDGITQAKLGVYFVLKYIFSHALLRA